MNQSLMCKIAVAFCLGLCGFSASVSESAAEGAVTFGWIGPVTGPVSILGGDN